MRIRTAISILVVLAGIAVFMMPDPAGGPAGIWHVAAAVIIAIGLWATGALPEYFTALIFFLLAITVSGLAPDLVFSGFYSSGAWLTFGGLVIGYAVHAAGLGRAIAARLLRRVGNSYLALLAGTVLAAALMGFIVPSNTARIVILVPIAVALADRLGFAAGSNGRAGLALAAAAGTLFPNFGVLPASVPNLIMLGAAESIHGVSFRYGPYLLANFPVISVTAILVLPLILRWLFPAVIAAPGESEAPGPLARGQITLSIVLVAALALWVTDFAHGVSPAWVALGAAILCLMPGLGIGQPKALVSEINLGPWIFIAGVIGAGTVVAKSGLGGLIAEHLFSAVTLSEGEDFGNLAIVSAIGMIMGLLAGIPGQPAIMTTLAPEIAAATGWPLATAIQAQVLSWVMTVFPYQLPPFFIAIQLGGLRVAQLVRVQVAMMLLAWLVMLPLLYLWWRALGLFG